jgi:hypothetical protein
MAANIGTTTERAESPSHRPRPLRAEKEPSRPTVLVHDHCDRRGPSTPSERSHECAKVCRNWCGLRWSSPSRSPVGGASARCRWSPSPSTDPATASETRSERRRGRRSSTLGSCRSSSSRSSPNYERGCHLTRYFSLIRASANACRSFSRAASAIHASSVMSSLTLGVMRCPSGVRSRSRAFPLLVGPAGFEPATF